MTHKYSSEICQNKKKNFTSDFQRWRPEVLLKSNQKLLTRENVSEISEVPSGCIIYENGLHDPFPCTSAVSSPIKVYFVE